MASTKAETKQSTGKRPYEASSEELQDETVSVKRTCLETEVNGENSATEPSGTQQNETQSSTKDAPLLTIFFQQSHLFPVP